MLTSGRVYRVKKVTVETGISGELRVVSCASVPGCVHKHCSNGYRISCRLYVLRYSRNIPIWSGGWSRLRGLWRRRDCVTVWSMVRTGNARQRAGKELLMVFCAGGREYCSYVGIIGRSASGVLISGAIGAGRARRELATGGGHLGHAVHIKRGLAPGWCSMIPPATAGNVAKRGKTLHFSGMFRGEIVESGADARISGRRGV
jgi:hypothetical protein